MAKKRNTENFWPSYVDLMTNLFAIMLVLFVATYFLFEKVKGDPNKNLLIDQLRAEIEKLKEQVDSQSEIIKNQDASIEQLKAITKLEEQFKGLSSSTTLSYDEDNKAFFAKELQEIEIFPQESADIKPEYRQRVRNVGLQLDKLLSSLNRDKVSKDFEYLMVIEGMTANNPNEPISKDAPGSYSLSYKRALALYRYWTIDCGIDLRQYNTEIQICGSGMNGKNRDKDVEANNKRFVVQIIPKLAKPSTQN